MTLHPQALWPIRIAFSIALVSCSSSDGPSGPAGGGGNTNGGQVGETGGALGISGGAGFGGVSSGGQGGAAGGGVPGGGGATSGQNCGIEVCSGARQCCPSTGKCYDPSFEGCGRISCTITSNDTGGGAGAANCCPMNLAHCAANDLCYHPACVGCCTP
jgi:hypothetical protein